MENLTFAQHVEQFEKFSKMNDYYEMENHFYYMPKVIETKEDYLIFLDLMLNNFDELSVSWENRSLYSYLEALRAFSDAIDGYYMHENMDPDKQPKWREFAKILTAAANYE